MVVYTETVAYADVGGFGYVRINALGHQLESLKSATRGESIPWVDNSLGCWWENVLIQTEFPSLTLEYGKVTELDISVNQIINASGWRPAKSLW